LKILTTGSQGMLGQDLVARLRLRHEIVPFTRNKADITDAKSIIGSIKHESPETVIHTAAFTAVDRCESEPQLAFQVNGEGTRNVAFACRELNIPLLYLSTDYVFDGEKDGPYIESDATNPLSVYGKSKLEGEKQVRQLLDRYWIVRTSWLYGAGGRSFVEAILNQAKQGASIRVVNDQIGSPTFTEDLATSLEVIVERGGPGIYHVSNQGSCSRFEFAQEILRQAGLNPSTVFPITTSAMDRRAKRPKNSRLSNARLAAEGLPHLPIWENGLHRYLLRTGEIRA
jgi:dTDP-4-dehydrorhamnose reductase